MLILRFRFRFGFRIKLVFRRFAADPGPCRDRTETGTEIPDS
jgi:hypothetical protein